MYVCLVSCVDAIVRRRVRDECATCICVLWGMVCVLVVYVTCEVCV